MKKIVLLLFVFLVFQQSANCQYSKGKFYIEATYNYFDNGKMVNDEGTQEITSTFSTNVGYFVVDHLVVGIGLNYHYWFNSQTYLECTSTQGGVVIDKIYFINSDMIKGVSPSVFVKYIYPVTPRLGVSIMAKSFMGKLTDHTYQSEKDIIQGTNNIVFTQSMDGNYKGVLLSPELRYLIKKQLGLQLNFNGLNIVSMCMSSKVNTVLSGMFQSTDLSPTATNKATGIDFAPKNWTLGVFLLL